jgi:hypothetical protein
VSGQVIIVHRQNNPYNPLDPAFKSGIIWVRFSKKRHVLCQLGFYFSRKENLGMWFRNSWLRTWTEGAQSNRKGYALRAKRDVEQFVEWDDLMAAIEYYDLVLESDDYAYYLSTVPITIGPFFNN